MITITQLEYVLAVDELRHFQKAAKHCHVTQPTLSMQIKKLEDELDIIIFDRSKLPILTTREGQRLINQSKIVLREYRQIYNLVDLDKEQLSGSFHLGVIPTISPYIIPLFARTFSKKYPEVNLIIEEYKTEDIISLLDEDRLDGGLLVTPLRDDRFIERSLFLEPFELFISPDHPFLNKKKVREVDLSLDDVWLLNEGHCFRNQVLNLCSVHKKKSRKNLSFESGNLETLKNLVMGGEGYTLLPYMATLNLRREYKKFLRSFSGKIPMREVSLVHGRVFLKEKIIDALEIEILSALPKELVSFKNKNVSIVEIT